MPKIIKIINESIELDEPNEIVEEINTDVKPKKVRKPRVVLLKKELIEKDRPQAELIRGFTPYDPPTASGIAYLREDK